jgi:hypothetical protein
MTEIFCFTQSLQVNVRIVPQFNHNFFLSYPFRFIILLLSCHLMLYDLELLTLLLINHKPQHTECVGFFCLASTSFLFHDVCIGVWLCRHLSFPVTIFSSYSVFFTQHVPVSMYYIYFHRQTLCNRNIQIFWTISTVVHRLHLLFCCVLSCLCQHRVAVLTFIPWFWLYFGALLHYSFFSPPSVS